MFRLIYLFVALLPFAVFLVSFSGAMPFPHELIGYSAAR